MKQNGINYIEISQEGYFYSDYRTMLDKLLEKGTATGGHTSEAYLKYSEMNIRRMRRLDKKPELLERTIEFLRSMDKQVLVLTLTEGWCGDAAQIIPVIERMAALSPNILTRYILRDEHPKVMDEYLTEGSRSIPISIFLDPSTGTPMGSWGPRPKEAQAIMRARKEEGGGDYSVVSERLHAWYAKDKTVSTQVEFVAELEKVVKTSLSHS